MGLVLKETTMAEKKSYDDWLDESRKYADEREYEKALNCLREAAKIKDVPWYLWEGLGEPAFYAKYGRSVAPQKKSFLDKFKRQKPP